MRLSLLQGRRLLVFLALAGCASAPPLQPAGASSVDGRHVHAVGTPEPGRDPDRAPWCLEMSITDAGFGELVTVPCQTRASGGGLVSP